MRNQFKITCPNCGVHFRLPLWFAGGTIGCPGCWKLINVPRPTTATTPPAKWRSRLVRTSNWLASWLRPPNPARSEGFLESRQWALDYTPREGEGYELALEYATKRYEEMLNLSEVLDKKLDDLARTSLAIGVLIATVARVLGAETPLGRSPMLIWSVISFALSVLVAVWSRGPTIYGRPLEIRNLLKVMDDHPELSKNKTQAVLASSYHVAVVGTYATNDWKARQLGRATIFLFAGIVLLIAMLIIAGPSDPSLSGRRVSDGRGQPAAGGAQRTRSDSSVAPFRSD